MTIKRAFIMDSISKDFHATAYNNLIRREEFYMYSDYAEKGGLNRTAIVFFDKHEDTEGLDFAKIEALIKERGDVRMPESALRGANTFSKWPANFATLTQG